MKTSDIVPISLSRRELYDLVWSVPIREAAARLGISRAWLTKICHRAAVPYPSRAYWGLLASGKRPACERLGSAGNRDDVIILRPRGRARPLGASMAEAGEDELVYLPERLTRLHPVLTAWRVEVWHEQDALRREPWRKHGPAPMELGKRRLRLLDALLKSMERRGHIIESCGAPPGLLCLLIDARKVEIVLRQDGPARRGTREQAPEADAAVLLATKPWLFSPPASVMSLELHAATEPLQIARWEDQPDVVLEERLGEIVVALSRMVAAPPAIGALLMTGEAGEGVGDIEERRWLVLRHLADQWALADGVHRLLDDVTLRAEIAGGPTAAQAVWLDWARQRAGRSHLQAPSLEELIAATDPASCASRAPAPVEAAPIRPARADRPRGRGRS